MNPAIEAEVIEPSNAIALRPSAPPALFGTTEPLQIVTKATEVADSLKAVIKKQGLITNIQGKEYPRCEAWTLLGTMLGVFPICVWTKQVEGGWEARVEARTRDGSILGAAEAQCCRSERNWSNRDDFALRSMAQTRATAKALRMPLGFVMTLAGFEATPSEEMEHVTPSKTVSPTFKSKAPAEPTKTPPSPTVAPKKARLEATVEQKQKMIAEIEAQGKEYVQKALAYFIDVGCLLPNESLNDIPRHWVPVLASEWRDLGVLIAKGSGKPDWVKSTVVQPETNPASAFNPEENEEHPFNEPAKTELGASIAEQAEFNDETWRTFPTPWGKMAGTPLGKLPKNTLFGYWANTKVETEYKGKPIAPEKIAQSRAFRAHLDQAGIHYKFEQPNQ